MICICRDRCSELRIAAYAVLGDEMNYRIVYPSKQKIRGRIRYCFRLPSLLLLSFAVFLVLMVSLWPEGAAVLKSLVFGDHESVTVWALSDLADDLQHGKGVVAALTDFCGKFIS